METNEILLTKSALADEITKKLYVKFGWKCDENDNLYDKDDNKLEWYDFDTYEVEKNGIKILLFGDGTLEIGFREEEPTNYNEFGIEFLKLLYNNLGE